MLLYRRRHCGLVSVPKSNWYTIGRPSHQKYNIRQQHDIIVTKQLKISILKFNNRYITEQRRIDKLPITANWLNDEQSSW
jgi:hypothetical protein